MKIVNTRKKYIDIAKFLAIFMLFIEHTELFANFTEGGV